MSREHVEADHWWFVPHGWIGCAGHIVEKDSETANMLGSVWTLSLCFWGQERGALRTPCTLVVERVHDRASTHQLLQKLDNRSPFNPVPIQGRTEDGELRWLDADEVLADLPFRVHTKSLWFALPALKEAEYTGAFEFRVE